MSELRALLVTPLSGPLASYGHAGATALRLWAEEAADVPPPWRTVRLHVRDAHPDAGVAMRSALALQPHVVFGPYGSGPTREALAASERVVWNHGGASSAIGGTVPANAVNVLAPASSYFHGTLEVVRGADPRARTLVVLHGESEFGAEVARGAIEDASRLHFEVTAIGFPPGQAGRSLARVPDADVLVVAARFEDELTCARELLDRAWRAAAFVGAGVEEVLASLGERREGLLGPAQWTAASAPKPDEGPDARWFVNRYRARAGSDPPYPAAQAFAAGVLAARCLRDTRSVDDAALLDAARKLECKTLYGVFRLDPRSGRQDGHEVLTVQWQGGARYVVWPPERADRPLVTPRIAG